MGIIDIKTKLINIFRSTPFFSSLIKNREFYDRTLDSIKFHRERDQKDDEKTSPKNDNIKLHCIWVSEVFTPSTLESLISSLGNMGWNYCDNELGDKLALSEWIVQNRSNLMGSGWINGGIVLNYADKGRFIGAGIRRSNLPKFVDYCHLSIRNITSSLTILTLQFVIKEDYHDLTPLLKEGTYQTKVEYKKSGIIYRGASYINIEQQKRTALKDKLDQMNDELYSWFSTNLSGLYSQNSINHPTVNLITSDEYKLLDSSKHTQSYIDLLFPYGTEIWSAEKELPVSLISKSLTSSPDPLLLFGNFKDLTLDNKSYGGETTEGLVNKLNSYLERNIDLLALHTSLVTHEKILTSIRDKSLSETKGLNQTIKDLNKIKTSFLSVSNDIQLMADDVLDLTNSKNKYSYDCVDFEPPKYYEGRISNLLEVLRQQDEMRIKFLRNLITAVGSSINSDINLNSTIINLKIQRTTIVLTLFTILLSILALWNLISDLYNWLIN